MNKEEREDLKKQLLMSRQNVWVNVFFAVMNKTGDPKESARLANEALAEFDDVFNPELITGEKND